MRPVDELDEVEVFVLGLVSNNDEAEVTTICPAACFARPRFLAPGTPRLAQRLSLPVSEHPSTLG